MRDPRSDLADEDGPAHFAADERRDGIEGETFVLATGNEHDRFGRSQERFFERVEIGRFRVVDVIDPAAWAGELEPVALGAMQLAGWAR